MQLKELEELLLQMARVLIVGRSTGQLNEWVYIFPEVQLLSSLPF